jgi:hypothetical protein
VTRAGTHLGWSTVTMSAGTPTLSVLDAHTGGLLFRRPLRSDARSGDASAGGLAYQYFPRAPKGGSQLAVDYTAKGWLAGNATSLSGNNSPHLLRRERRRQVAGLGGGRASSGHRWDYPLQPFTVPACPSATAPTPAPGTRTCRSRGGPTGAQNAAQVFFYVNNWHDHLVGAPIGFTEAAGNFQLRNSTRSGLGGDAVDTQTDDGANTAGGLPDGNHSTTPT